MRVVAYASRGLSRSEKNYPVHKLEFLALKWAISEKFQDHLYGVKFKVLTDNNPLTYVLTSVKLDTTGHCWLAALAMLDFDIFYKSGKKNADADGLSRKPQDALSDDEDTLEMDNKIALLKNRVQPIQENDQAVFRREALVAVCQKHQVMVLRILANPENAQVNVRRGTAIKWLL